MRGYGFDSFARQWIKDFLLREFNWNSFAPTSDEHYVGTRRFGFVHYHVHGIHVDQLVKQPSQSQYAGWFERVQDRNNTFSFLEIFDDEFMCEVGVSCKTRYEHTHHELIHFDGLIIEHFKRYGDPAKFQAGLTYARLASLNKIS